MIRCLCTGTSSLARLLSPSARSTDWPPGVEAFLSGEQGPASSGDGTRSEEASRGMQDIGGQIFRS